LVAPPGGGVFVPFHHVLTLPDVIAGSVRTIAHDRPAIGKISPDDVMSDPDMMRVLGPLQAPPPGSSVEGISR
jgi:hypothetical protein